MSIQYIDIYIKVYLGCKLKVVVKEHFASLQNDLGFNIQSWMHVYITTLLEH